MKVKIERERVYSTREVAIILDVCEATVRSWIKRGEIRRGHSVSSQGFVVTGYTVIDSLQGNPRYDRKDDSVEIPDEKRLEYLLAAKDKCTMEIRGAKSALHRELSELNDILEELF